MLVHELLCDRSKWIQNGYARDTQGMSVEPTDFDAVAWCIVGAIEKCYGIGTRENVVATLQVRNALESLYPTRAIMGWQDIPSRTFAEVQAVLALANV